MTVMPRLEVTVEVDRTAPSTDTGFHVSGTVRDEDGAEEPFVGWIGLLALLQRSLTMDVP
jgi:hypothetical protein